MESDAWNIRFENCNSSKTQQQWVIWKMGNGRDYIRVCQQRYEGRGGLFRKLPAGFLGIYYCVGAAVLPFNPIAYRKLFQSISDRLTNKSEPIKDDKEARELLFISNNEKDVSQQWIMNRTTHQLANVKYPKGCMTTKHFKDPALGLLLQCEDIKSPNPQMTKHQRFSQTPALDKNGKQLCTDFVY